MLRACLSLGRGRMWFFFSRRRRHTSYWRDWSSDVCSSDLVAPPAVPRDPDGRGDRFIPCRVAGRRASLARRAGPRGCDCGCAARGRMDGAASPRSAVARGAVIRAEPLLRVRDLATTLRPPAGLDRAGGPAPFTLRGVSFNVEPGDEVAVIGPNGAGKTTLLRLLAGVYRAQAGELRARGRVSAVIGWLPVFSAELTPREHVRAYGVVAGAELDVDAVIRFAGLDAVAARPVRLLSAGEQARLALALGLSAPADVYLIDEGLALCEPTFRTVATDHLRRRAAQGAAVILAGQDLLTARALCRRGLLLLRGRLIADTDVDAAIAAFTMPAQEQSGGGVAAAVIEGVEIESAAASDGEPIGLRCRVRTDPGTFLLLIAVKRPNGAIVHSSRSAVSQAADGARRPVRTLATGIPASSLPPGTYQIAVAVTDAKGVPLATRENAAVLDRSTPIS